MEFSGITNNAITNNGHKESRWRMNFWIFSSVCEFSCIFIWFVFFSACWSFRLETKSYHSSSSILSKRLLNLCYTRRTRHAGHCWRSRDELIRDVLLWIPTHGRAKAGRPARTYIQQLCEDTGCCPEDLPRAMNDREEWRERVRDIRAASTIWWWWWWWCYTVTLLFEFSSMWNTYKGKSFTHDYMRTWNS